MAFPLVTGSTSLLEEKYLVPDSQRVFGGRRIFDRTVFHRWWNLQGRRVPSWPGYTSVERRGGGAFKEVPSSSGNPCKRDLKASLSQAS